MKKRKVQGKCNFLKGFLDLMCGPSEEFDLMNALQKQAMTSKAFSPEAWRIANEKVKKARRALSRKRL